MKKIFLAAIVLIFTFEVSAFTAYELKQCAAFVLKEKNDFFIVEIRRRYLNLKIRDFTR